MDITSSIIGHEWCEKRAGSNGGSICDQMESSCLAGRPVKKRDRTPYSTRTVLVSTTAPHPSVPLGNPSKQALKPP
jgi:hypothetical protein